MAVEFSIVPAKGVEFTVTLLPDSGITVTVMTVPMSMPLARNIQPLKAQNKRINSNDFIHYASKILVMLGVID